MANTLAAAIIGVASVIDGDTLEIHGERIRLWGVDAPERSQTCEVAGSPWRCGSDAANVLDARIARRTVTCEVVDRDRYDRTVARCAVGGESINAWLVSSGLAVENPRYSRGAYTAEQRDAQASSRGVWKSRFEMPWDWRNRQRRSD